MHVLAIEHTVIDGNDVTVTAVVDEMRLIHKSTHLDPDEYAPALCRTSKGIVNCFTCIST